MIALNALRDGPRSPIAIHDEVRDQHEQLALFRRREDLQVGLGRLRIGMAALARSSIAMSGSVRLPSRRSAAMALPSRCSSAMKSSESSDIWKAMPVSSP